MSEPAPTTQYSIMPIVTLAIAPEPQRCSICGEPLRYPVPFTGYRVVHPDCYQRATGQLIDRADLMKAELIAKAVKFNQRSNAERWKICLIAAHLVGKYERGATLALASELRLSVAQVEHLAIAGKVYTSMLSWGRRSNTLGLVPEIRRLHLSLSITHWTVLGEAMSRYAEAATFTPALAFNYLSDADEKHAPVSMFRSAIDAEFGKPPELPGSDRPLFGSETQPAGDHAREVMADIERAEPVEQPAQRRYSGRVVVAGEKTIEIEVDDPALFALGAHVTVIVEGEA